MPRIRQLSPAVVNKIAAGEVVERPASVVKELLENSIDAGAQRLDIDLEQGGVELIGVVDGGCGIEPEDLPLAFASHATSKLQGADDLFRIGTLGFRGEALASIGGVARVTIQSRAAGRPSGAELTCNGGELLEARPWNGSVGTRLEVRQLIFNTPVRKKFLRTAGTELGQVSETVTRLALAYPSVQVTLRHNGRLVHDVPGNAPLLERIGLFFGSEVRDQLHPLAAEQGSAKLTGLIADPACERGNAKLQYLFVNGRWVRDRSLMHALQEAYRGLLMRGRYPVAFLFLTLPADQVDVNVHPTKSEVRFRDGHALFQLVRGGVRQRLSEEKLIPRLTVPEPARAEPVPPAAVPEPEPRWEHRVPPPGKPSAFEPSPRREVAERTVAPCEEPAARQAPGMHAAGPQLSASGAIPNQGDAWFGWQAATPPRCRRRRVFPCRSTTCTWSRRRRRACC